MEKVFLDIALILIFTKIGSMLSKKVNMPEVLGALLVGIILGPSILGIINQNDFIKLLSELGVIFLMFLAGIETNLDELKKAGLSSFLIAIGGIILPFLLGFYPTYLLTSSFWPSIFIGVILTATSVSISVQTLNELGKLNTRSGMNILGAAVIDDILGLIIISFVLVLAKSAKAPQGTNMYLDLLFVSLKVIVFCVVSFGTVAFLPKFINKFTKKYGKTDFIVIFSIALTLLCAFAANKLGIAAITGAYICGLTLSSVTHKDYIQKKVHTISSLFLTPIFFASVGFATNIRTVNGHVALISIIMLIAAVIGKVAGCGLTAKFFGMSNSECLQIGFGMISRGEVALITTNLGLQNKIISAELFVPTLIVVLVTTIITPVLLKFAFSDVHTHQFKASA